MFETKNLSSLIQRVHLHETQGIHNRLVFLLKIHELPDQILSDHQIHFYGIKSWFDTETSSRFPHMPLFDLRDINTPPLLSHKSPILSLRCNYFQKLPLLWWKSKRKSCFQYPDM